MENKESNNEVNDMIISIITINYNNKAGLERTMQSVLSQTVYDKIEYIVVDGASTDGSAEVLKQHESLLSYAISEPDSGIYNAMNKGIRMATGDYCLFLNSGDSLYDTSVVERCIPLLGQEDFIFGRVQLSPSGKIAWDDVSLPLTMADFFKSSPIPHQGCFIRKSLFDKELYDESLHIVSDWKFFLRMIIFNDCSYKMTDNIISFFEENGISSDSYVCDKERACVLKELLPNAILLDYYRGLKGEDYCNSEYNAFFTDLHHYNERFAKMIFRLSLYLTFMMSFLIRGLKFVEKYRNCL